ncbi:MAG TPA: hypothetical protein VMR75_02640 [Candidatus Saccharimonadales bacterium]|nr:hypothetical protein [Candidatus Saccharimonadales bacterium]
MFTRLMSHWRSAPRWARVVGGIVATLVVLYLLWFLVYLAFGSLSGSEAQAATPRPTKAWLQQGTIASSHIVPGAAAVVAHSATVTSVEHSYEKYFANPFGQKLIWLKMSQETYYSKTTHSITYAPPAIVTAGITTLGTITQWKVSSIDKTVAHQYYPYEGYLKGGFLSKAVLYLTRCFPSPFGCIDAQSASRGIEIRSHYDGTASYY